MAEQDTGSMLPLQILFPLLAMRLRIAYLNLPAIGLTPPADVSASFGL
ncbi:hypothetical protein [Rhodoplanes roseus]|nr:hypothetical protein [Rhodoplanes roseus]